METFEDLGAVLGTVEVDSDALLSRAVDAGRRRQRRRRLGGSVAALAMASLAVGVSLHLAGSTGAGDAGVATDPTASPGDGPASARLADARLVERLPVPGDLVSATTGDGGVAVVRSLDPDGSGHGTVSLDLGRGRPLSTGQQSDADDKCREIARHDGPESCKKVDGGWVFSLVEQPRAENAPPRRLDWSATMVRMDGNTVAVHATNYVDGHLPTRPTPVLDAEQLGLLAIDPVWFEPAS